VEKDDDPMNHRRLARALPLFLCALGASCSPGPRSAADASAAERSHAIEQLGDATAVMADMVRSGKVPVDQRDGVKCVAVVPALVSGGLIVGARHGSGVVTCRTPDGWSGPAFVTITGGSAGLQVGVESADVVMLVRSARGMTRLFRSSFELGADTSAAAGPVGRAAQAGTDTTMSAEIVSFARSRGLFAGVELSGAAMEEDRAADRALYAGSRDVQAILAGQVPAPSEAGAFLAQIREVFPPKAQ
jgi:lipid-binding SYLF domain-containing protein